MKRITHGAARRRFEAKSERPKDGTTGTKKITIIDKTDGLLSSSGVRFAIWSAVRDGREMPVETSAFLLKVEPGDHEVRVTVLKK